MERNSAAHERRQPNDNGLAKNEGRPARDIAPGERWTFDDHRSMAEVIAAERQP